MIWTICLITAMAVLFVSVIGAVAVGKKVKANRFVTPFNTVFAGLFITTLVMMIPVYRSVCAGAQLSPLKTVLFTIQGTLQVFQKQAKWIKYRHPDH